jgi:hypothetical protein
MDCLALRAKTHTVPHPRPLSPLGRGEEENSPAPSFYLPINSSTAQLIVSTPVRMVGSGTG